MDIDGRGMPPHSASMYRHSWPWDDTFMASRRCGFSPVQCCVVLENMVLDGLSVIGLLVISTCDSRDAAQSQFADM